MTVAELISELKKYPPQMRVYLQAEIDYDEAKGVEKRKFKKNSPGILQEMPWSGTHGVEKTGRFGIEIF